MFVEGERKIDMIKFRIEWKLTLILLDGDTIWIHNADYYLDYVSGRYGRFQFPGNGINKNTFEINISKCQRD